MLEIDMGQAGIERIFDRAAPLDEIVPGLVFGEGPLWNQRTDELFFVDIIDDKIWKWKPGVGKTIVVHPSGKANGLTFDREGRILIAGWGSRKILRLDLRDGSLATVATHYEGKKFNSPNDIVVKSDGAVYWTDSVGGMYNVGMAGEDIQRYLDVQGVYRLAPDGERIDLVIPDLTYPNGLCFSPDEKLLYANDTRLGEVRVYEVRPDGLLAPGRLFHKLKGSEPGVADGMKVDREGNLYTTGPGGLHVIAPSGELIGRLRLPHAASNLAWGGSDWKTLYITCHECVYRTKGRIAGVPVN